MALYMSYIYPNSQLAAEEHGSIHALYTKFKISWRYKSLIQAPLFRRSPFLLSPTPSSITLSGNQQCFVIITVFFLSTTLIILSGVIANDTVFACTLSPSLAFGRQLFGLVGKVSVYKRKKRNFC